MRPGSGRHGFVLPPVAATVMTAPILVGLVTPPVGLSLFVIDSTYLWGPALFLGCMIAAIVILCVAPGLATWRRPMGWVRG